MGKRVHHYSPDPLTTPVCFTRGRYLKLVDGIPPFVDCKRCKATAAYKEARAEMRKWSQRCKRVKETP